MALPQMSVVGGQEEAKAREYSDEYFISFHHVSPGNKDTEVLGGP